MQRSRDLFTLPLETGIPNTKVSIYVKCEQHQYKNGLNIISMEGLAWMATPFEVQPSVPYQPFRGPVEG